MCRISFGSVQVRSFVSDDGRCPKMVLEAELRDFLVDTESAIARLRFQLAVIGQFRVLQRRNRSYRDFQCSRGDKSRATAVMRRLASELLRHLILEWPCGRLAIKVRTIQHSPQT